MAVNYPVAVGQRAYAVWGQIITTEARGHTLPTPPARGIVTEDDAVMALKQVAMVVDSVMDPANPKLEDDLVAHIMAMLAVARDYVRPLPELVQLPAGTVAEDLRQLVETLRLAKLEP